MGAAIWSCTTETFESFPMRFILEFYRNHGLMQMTDRPVWRVVCGGSRQYVGPLVQPFHERIRCRSPVMRVHRREDAIGVEVCGREELFDELIFACHSDQALRILEDPGRVERSLLEAFPYRGNVATLHTDTSVLPRRRAAWSSWNYRVPASPETRPRVTYNMNLLQGLASRTTICVSLNEEDAIDPRSVLGTFSYHHPVFTLSRSAAQSRHGEMIRRDRISYCGAYWGNGFHEDGVQSALAVAREYGITPAWANRTRRDPEGSRPRTRTRKVREAIHVG
jgi:predicted NAD/FAD-binding protein